MTGLTIARDVDNIIVKARPIHNLPSSLLSSLFALMAGMRHGQDILTHRGWDNESASIKNQAFVNGEVVAEGPGGYESVLQDLHAKPLESWIFNLIQLLRIKYRDEWLVVCENTKCW